MQRTAILSLTVLTLIHADQAAAAPPRYEAILVEGPGGWDLRAEHRGTAISGDLFIGQLLGSNRRHSLGFAVAEDGERALLHPLAGYNNVGVRAVNSNGLIVGSSGRVLWNGHYRSQATAWIKGEPIDLGSLGGGRSWANDVNDAGVILGISVDEDRSRSWACVWVDGQIELLPVPDGAQLSIGDAISDSGYAAGGVMDKHGDYRAARWLPDGDVQLLSLPGDHIVHTWAVDVNDHGDVLVRVTQDDPPMIWSGVWSGGTLKPLPTGSFAASSINNHGQVVGWEGSNGPVYVDEDGIFSLADQIDIGPTNLAYAVQIDDRGWIVGSVRTDYGQLRPVLLKPIEEAGLPDE